MHSEEKIIISAETILLDVVSRWPATEAVIKKYDEKAGVCLCCSCLFDTIGDITARFAMDEDAFLSELQKVIGQKR
ncbi:MAG TPA: hypothetical protein PKZ12_02065 [Smithellaceae bacterium]|nr:hypothetical protein [Smithellaceae bacterium]